MERPSSMVARWRCWVCFRRDGRSSRPSAAAFLDELTSPWGWDLPDSHLLQRPCRQHLPGELLQFLSGGDLLHSASNRLRQTAETEGQLLEENFAQGEDLTFLAPFPSAFLSSFPAAFLPTLTAPLLLTLTSALQPAFLPPLLPPFPQGLLADLISPLDQRLFEHGSLLEVHPLGKYSVRKGPADQRGEPLLDRSPQLRFFRQDQIVERLGQGREGLRVFIGLDSEERGLNRNGGSSPAAGLPRCSPSSDPGAPP